jgi:CheY-like chemotaxis protein
MLSILRSRPRVLLLDDDPAIRRLVTTLLKREGLRVDVVEKGQAAIDKLSTSDYDAVVLDLMMPHEGGVTVLRHLREHNPSVLARVVLLTAAPPSVLRTYEQDVVAVIRKPFEAAELVRTIAGVANGKA